MRSAQPALRRLAALISTIDTVTKLLRSGKTVVLLSLDFSKAFDRIRHAQGKACIPKLAGTEGEIGNRWIVVHL